MDLKGLIADQMGHFTPYDVLGALLCVLLAALLGYLLAFIGRAEAPSRPGLAVLAAIVAFAVALVRASVPLSIALVAVALLLGGQRHEGDRHGLLLRYGAAAIGVGCGSSASIMVVALIIPIGLLLRWASAPKA